MAANQPNLGDIINRERREQERHMQKEALRLTYYYFVFQGVILTAVYSTSEHVKCRYRWVPFTLSSLAGFLNLCVLLRIMCEMMRDLNRRRFAIAFGFMAIVIGFFSITLVGCWFITCGDKSISPLSPHPAA